MSLFCSLCRPTPLITTGKRSSGQTTKIKEGFGLSKFKCQVSQNPVAGQENLHKGTKNLEQLSTNILTKVKDVGLSGEKFLLQ